MELNPDIHAGTLSDTHIRQAANNNWLISEHFEDVRVRQACYELRAGCIYYELDTADNRHNATRHEIQSEEYILLKPKQFITIITHEKLKLPANVLGRVLTKGQLFSIGLIPVNTYADPGFEGNLGIVLANLSNNYLKIKHLDPIAKIEFSKLRQPVSKPYKGQHGYESAMWPVPYHMILSQSEVANDKRIKQPLEELESSHGRLLASYLQRVFRFERYLALASALYFTVSILVLAFLLARQETGFTQEVFSAVILGVVSNLIFGALMYCLPPSKR